MREKVGCNRCAFFFQTLPMSLRFTCSPQVCLGLVRMTTHTATDQVNSWSSYLVAPGLCKKLAHQLAMLFMQCLSWFG